MQQQIADMTLTRAGHLGEARGSKWLIEGIWAASGTGILAGMPKTGKTWTLLEMAVAVASGRPFLDKWPVSESGPVVIYSPEGPTSELDDRLRQVAARKGLRHLDLDIYLASKKSLFLDIEQDQRTVYEAVGSVRPRAVFFDPLAECFAGDENSAGDVLKMTRFVLDVAKTFSCAVIITHHIVKASNGKGNGAGMRGSSALFGFGDSYLFLAEGKGHTRLTSTQRHGRPASPTHLALTEADGNWGYSLCHAPREEEQKPTVDRIIEMLKASDEAILVEDIRQRLGVRHSEVSSAIKYLTQHKIVKKLKKGGIKLEK